MKVKVRSPDGVTDYFVIVTAVLQGDTLAPYPLIICLDYVLRTTVDLMKENGFMLAKKRNRRYLTQTITNADYADDIALLENTPAQTGTSSRWHRPPCQRRQNSILVIYSKRRHLHTKCWS